MVRMLLFLTIALAANMMGSTAVLAEDAAGVQRAKEFWATIAKGDTAATKDFYAKKVTLRPGSELLKAEWGIEGAGDRSKPLAVSRDDLIAAYQRMIGKLGREKWARIFGTIPADKVVVTSDITSAQSPALNTSAGDLVLMVQPGKDDNRLYYVFRQGETGAWQIVVELTDY